MIEEKRVKVLQREIRRLLEMNNGLMLAHNYQRDEIQEVADITGDSLGLSQAAAESDADVIVFCGVHFMAESVSILCPDKTVLLPRIDAGCPMAEMITADQLRLEKEKRPGIPVVAYVNTSAGVKALSDICCTSANAVKVIESLGDGEVYMIPDRNLSQYVASKVTNTIHWWDGFCATHDRLTLPEVLSAREEFPDASFICHPECRPEVVAAADEVCSTSGIYKFAAETDIDTIIVGTEMGILYRLRKENPDKKFIIPSRSLICPNMKLTTLEDVVRGLREMDCVVTVSSSIRASAGMALDRMLSIPRDI